MQIGLEFAVEFESQDLKIGIILAVLKHSGKIPSDHELFNSIETVGEIRGLKFCTYIYRNIHEISGLIIYMIVIYNDNI